MRVVASNSLTDSMVGVDQSEPRIMHGTAQNAGFSIDMTVELTSCRSVSASARDIMCVAEPIHDER